MHRRHVKRGLVVPGLIAALWLVGCVPPEPPEVPRPEPPRIFEEEVKPVETIELQIIDLNETPNPTDNTVTVSGRLVNRGTRTTREVSVHVEALDKDGAVVLSTAPEPSTQMIAPASTATFTAAFENRPDIDRYHVEAIGR